MDLETLACVVVLLIARDRATLANLMRARLAAGEDERRH
jgi:hypothetical protein